MALHPGAQQSKPLKEKFDKRKIIPVLSYTTASGNWNLRARKKKNALFPGESITGDIFERDPTKIHLWHRKHRWYYSFDTNTIFWQTKPTPPKYVQQIALELSQYLISTA